MKNKKSNKNSKIENFIQKAVEEVAGKDQEFIYGFSYVKDYVPKKARGLDYCITIGLKLDDEIINSISEGPTRRYLEHYNNMNQTLREVSGMIEDDVKKNLGCRAMAFPPSTSDRVKKTCKYQKELRSEFSHKIGATRSGLGWIGKTALLVTKRFGPRLRLASVLTDYELDVGQSIEESLCGGCTVCVESCPANSGRDILWQLGMKREEIYDPFGCRDTCEKLTTEFIGEAHLICGICVSVCPYGKSKKG
jgi:epoxyqueuosine reductase